MRFGFVVPYASGREFAELAALGERHGWDAVFTWEAVWGEHAWVVLGAAAMATERIRLGTLLTPASRWRPWDLASAVGTVGGRAKTAPAQASALYLCLYYLGSSVAGSAGGVFYSRGGWPLVAAFAAALLGIALASALSLRR
jgi:Luciferase-like monooxygenase